MHRSTHTSLFAIFLGVSVMLGFSIPQATYSQCFCSCLTSAFPEAGCPRDVIEVRGNGFNIPSNLTVGGVSTTIAGCPTCPGPLDTLFFPIPSGLPPGPAAVEFLSSNCGTIGGVSVNICGISPSANCIGEKDTVYYDFSGGNAILTLRVDGILVADQSSATPEPAPDMIGTGAVEFSIPSGTTIGATVNVDITFTGGGGVSYPLDINSDGAAFHFFADTLCGTLTNVPIDIAPMRPDSFYSVPPGLISDQVTGEMNPSAVATGDYLVWHFTNMPLFCDSTHSLPIHIYDVADPTVTYSQPNWCQGTGLIASPAPAPAGSGKFSSIPSTTALNTTTGDIDIDAASPGSYRVVYTLAEGSQCQRTDTFDLVIGSLPTINFSYDIACINNRIQDPIAIPGAGHSTGGTYSDVSGLLTMLNPGTGLLDMDSIPSINSWSIAYEVTDSLGCVARDTQYLVVQSGANSSVQYVLPEYCISAGATALPTTGRSRGNFTYLSLPGLTLDMDPFTGRIDLSPAASDTGTYDIIYTLSAAVVDCPSADTTQVRIVEAPDPGFSFLGGTTSFCQLDPDPTPSVNSAGGVFSELTGGNITFIGSNGTIDLSASVAGGPYVINHQVTAGTCSEDTNLVIYIEDSLDAAFYYSTGTTMCMSDPDPLPTILGGGGGTFSTSDPVNCKVDSMTGAVLLDSCLAGNYTIYYTVGTGGCAGLDSSIILINAPPIVEIEYTNPVVCTDSLDPTPTLTISSGSVGGGTWTSLPAGEVSLNASGVIDIAGSTVGGPYLVVYTTPGLCASIAQDTVWIMYPAPATFYFTDSAYCPNDTSPLPVVTGLGGGIWDVAEPDSVIWLNQNTGRVDLNLSADNYSHAVIYQSPGPCPATFVDTLIILEAGDASIQYLGGPFCSSDAINPLPTMGDPGSAGIFVALDPNIAVDSTTGEVYIDSSATGTGEFTISYSVGGGVNGCPDQGFATISIGLADSSSITYNPDSLSTVPPHFCENGNDPFPDLDGTPGGTYSSQDPVFFANDATGLVDVSRTGARAAPYTVTYLVGSICAGSNASASFFIDPVDTAEFYYADLAGDTITEFCNTQIDPIPMPVNLFPSVFTKGADTVPLGLDSLTGQVDLGNSQPGSYNVFHYTEDTVSGCRDTFSLQIQVNEDPAVTMRSNLKDSIICEGSVVKLTALGGNPLVDSFSYEISQDTGGTWSILQEIQGEIGGNVLERTDIPLGFNLIRTTLTNSFGCQDDSIIYLVVNPVPDGEILSMDSVISGQQRILARVISYTDDTQFSFSLKGIGDVRPAFASGLTDTLQTNDVYDIQTTQVVTIGTNNPSQIRVSIFPIARGCVGPVTVDTIRVIPNNQDFFIPEVITPDGNDQNDYWLVQWNQRINPNDYFIEVYNRSGGLVYTLEELDVIWYANGLPHGIYWWVLKKRENNRVVDKGGLKIIRE